MTQPLATKEKKPYEEIGKEYRYDGKNHRTNVLHFPDMQIATITKTVENEYGNVVTEVAKQGMTREQIETFFPPPPQQARYGKTFNRALLIRSIIYEAFRKESKDMEEGNVRNFWYTHVKRTLTRVLGLSEDNSVTSTINSAWGDMINSGLVTYEGMNIIGGKEQTRLSMVKDSPFSNLIIAVEKEDFFNKFSWLPRLFNCTLITAGGQPSRAVARAFILQLKKLNVDLDQTFYMCVASDLDPAGYYIQETFRKQFEAAIQYYGGDGSVEIRRLFVRKDQVSDELLENEAMPCRDKASSKKARKAEDTKWEHFVEETDGGLYISPPPGWNGPTYTVDGEEKVRALLEMNAFGKRIIENAIVEELLEIIEKTSDESKIMIPEIMRVFEEKRKEAIEQVYKTWHKKLIDPRMEDFLSDTKDWGRDIDDQYWEERDEAKEKRDEARTPIDEKYDELVEEQEEKAYRQEPDLHDERAYIEWQIQELRRRKQEISKELAGKCSDIHDEIERLEDKRNEETQPIEEEYNEAKRKAEAKRGFRKKQLKRLREEQATIFNPMEAALKSDVATVLSPENVTYYFTDLEQIDTFQPHITRMLTQPYLLTEQGVTCFEHPAPAFQQPGLLGKAARQQDENVGAVRKAFTPEFLQHMQDFIASHAEDVTFEIESEIEDVDLSGEIRQAKEETEEAIEAGKWEEGS